MDDYVGFFYDRQMKEGRAFTETMLMPLAALEPIRHGDVVT